MHNLEYIIFKYNSFDILNYNGSDMFLTEILILHRISACDK